MFAKSQTPSRLQLSTESDSATEQVQRRSKWSSIGRHIRRRRRYAPMLNSGCLCQVGGCLTGTCRRLRKGRQKCGELHGHLCVMFECGISIRSCARKGNERLELCPDFNCHLMTNRKQRLSVPRIDQKRAEALRSVWSPRAFASVRAARTN